MGLIFMMVYRIEHESVNYGPFFAWLHVNSRYYDDERLGRVSDRVNKIVIKRPSGRCSWIRFDINGRNRRDYRFGCLTMKSLVSWFHGTLGLLERNRFMVAIYQVDEKYIVVEGNQVNFNKKMATLIERRRILHVRKEYMNYLAWLDKIRNKD